MEIPSFKEDHISQIPALQLLINMGYNYLTPGEALELRGGKKGKVVLTSVLERKLREINTIEYLGEQYPFSNRNISNAVKAIDDVMIDNVARTNEQIYDLLCLGKSFEENIKSNIRSYTMKYIDWDKIDNNTFQVTEEFEVETDDGKGHRRPDIVAFVNGIPLVVIECKRPDEKDSIDQAVSQNIRNQKRNEIQRLFIYSQILLAISKNEGKYATATTKSKFWSVWKERKDEDISELINRPLQEDQKNRLFSERYSYVRQYFDQIEKEKRQITEQDRTLHSLLKKERLLELTRKFIIFDKGEKKICRYQQYFAVNKTMKRVRTFQASNKRNGGVIWHTQGSGKSLTMVWLSKALAMDRDIPNARVVIVTDRINLDKQIKDTFHYCGMEPHKARTGEDLFRQLEGKRTMIITSVIDKFVSALNKRSVKIKDPNIFVLVDESHRSQYGESHARMKLVLPNACYIGFTGTPLMKKDRSTVERFGGFIDKYTIDQAVKDKAVVPLLYEGRHVPQKVDRTSIDNWFDMVTAGLTDEQKADLKKNYSRVSKLNSTDQKIHMIAFDISEHYRRGWKGTKFKAQVATPSKAAALKYKDYLDEFGAVESEVVISSPDTREGHEDPLDEVDNEVQIFWKNIMERFRTEENYNETVVNDFKFGETPELLIVVDKLLTGFDAPNNTILYLAKPIKEHTLLQAIARVNRVKEGKDYGYIIDYAGILGELDKALSTYSALEEFDEKDLENTLTNVMEEIRNLPQRHSDLWEVFRTIKNRRDEEEYELLLADQEIRDIFYERLSSFSRTLSIALSTPKFFDEERQETIKRYKDDLGFFQKLRVSVKKRYAEIVDISEYEPKIKKLLDTYVTSDRVEIITEEVNIFNKEKFEEELAKLRGKGSQADTIAHRTLKTIQDKWEEDPAFYRKFSDLIRAAIDDYRQKRIDENDYFKRATDIKNHVLDRKDENEPEILEGNDVAKAFFGVTFSILSNPKNEDKVMQPVRELSAILAIAIDDIIRDNKVVDWQKKEDIQNRMKMEISDYLIDKDELHLDFDDVDMILEKVMDIARRRYAS
ncbi:MAG: HsdR family type I site-specific deoxyribonuclease [Candidatus Thermoplasmatota archaeon]|nr:HsdR family type I site-specific deoxyribonuclease [Candidatus Thermoplasmatota archaeon]